MDQLIERRYWASRPDRHNPEVFADELRKGRLRQGWGYSDECNLEAIRQKYWDDAKGWQGLPDELHAVIQNYPFDPNWPTGQATMRAGDIVLVPNIPKWGFFSLVEIQDDEYQFEPIQLNEKQKDRDYNLEQDYGHYRKVKLLTPVRYLQAKRERHRRFADYVAMPIPDMAARPSQNSAGPAR